jgi:hypothetical protein
MNQVETEKMCRLRAVARGESVPCPGDRCVFWEPGGAVVESGCGIERLGIDLSQPGLADYLLGIRERLEQGGDVEDAEAAHREFARRLGRDV